MVTSSVRLLLQRVDHPIALGSTHLDFKVRDVTKAIAEIEAIGGKLRKSAAFYPNVENPDLEWAVMQDPWVRRSASSAGRFSAPGFWPRTQ